MIRRIQSRILTIRQIRSAILHQPDGLCFAEPDGRPILANDAIQKLSSCLSGHTLIDAESTWQEWKELSHSVTGSTEETGEQLIVDLPEGRTWQITRLKLRLGSGDVFQITASDITELRLAEQKLRADNQKLCELTRRQRDLLADIVRNNRETEILNVKMDIHSRFGALLVAGKKWLRDPEPSTGQEPCRREELPAFSAEQQEWLSAWEAVLAHLEHSDFDDSRNVPSPQEELFRVAEMIGCQIRLQGDFPQEKRAGGLLTAVIREALTNAVRHGGANLLEVSLKPEESFLLARITDNGSSSPQIQEGGGLSSLRRKLEQAGGSLQVTGGEQVLLSAQIPRE